MLFSDFNGQSPTGAGFGNQNGGKRSLGLPIGQRLEVTTHVLFFIFVTGSFTSFTMFHYLMFWRWSCPGCTKNMPKFVEISIKQSTVLSVFCSMLDWPGFRWILNHSNYPTFSQTVGILSWHLLVADAWIHLQQLQVFQNIPLNHNIQLQQQLIITSHKKKTLPTEKKGQVPSHVFQLVFTPLKSHHQPTPSPTQDHFLLVDRPDSPAALPPPALPALRGGPPPRGAADGGRRADGLGVAGDAVPWRSKRLGSKFVIQLTINNIWKNHGGFGDDHFCHSLIFGFLELSLRCNLL